MGAIEIFESMVASDLPQRMQSLSDIVQAEDGAAPFSEQAHVEVIRVASNPQKAATSTLKVFEAQEGSQLVGLAVLVRESDTWVLEAAVTPASRGQGIGQALVAAALQSVEGQPVAAWVHGGPQERTPALESALALARKLGWQATRELYKLELPLTKASRTQIQALSDAAQLPPGLELAAYTPALAQSWVELNAQAFAHHPEQGRLTLEDLYVRTESSWFRADGFFLVRAAESTTETPTVKGSPLAGYHWTKIPTGQGAEPEGEVYAIGISPHWQGRGLGKALTLAGMDYLARATDEQGRALSRIVLYVDADNTAAVSLYRSLGFIPLTVDQQYRPGQPTGTLPCPVQSETQ